MPSLASGRVILLYRGGLEVCYKPGVGGTLGLKALRTSLAAMYPHAAQSLVPISEALTRAFSERPEHSEKIVNASLLARALIEPAPVSQLLNGPFLRIYDASCSNAFDLEETPPIARAAGSDVPLENKRQLVRLGSIPSDEGNVRFLSPPDAEFSEPGYRQWFRRFLAEAQANNLLVLAESLEDPDLWDYLKMLRRPATTTWHTDIVTLTGDRSLVSRAEGLGMHVVEESPADFCRIRLAPSRHDVATGQRVVARYHAARGGKRGLTIVGGITQRGRRSFLEGLEPTFADVQDGYAAKLDSWVRLEEAVKESFDDYRPLLVHGPVGCGKSTTLKAVALSFVGRGQTIGWIDRATEVPLKKLLDQSRDLELDAVFIDDVDIFGDAVYQLVRGLSGQRKSVVVASCRNTRLQYVQAQAPAARKVNLGLPLSRKDLGRLVTTLKANGLLGILRSEQPYPEAAIDRLALISSGDLLAVMIQVVTGEPFDDRVRSELQQLDTVSRLVYSVVSLFRSIREVPGLLEAQLVEICSEVSSPREVAGRFDELVASGLVVRGAFGEVGPRHPAIGERVVELLKGDKEALPRMMRSLVMYFASIAHSIGDPSVPERRAMKRLINHSLMAELGLSPQEVRDIYDAVLDYLDKDYHYWLQRAAYEVERADRKLSWRHIQSAMLCEGGARDHLTLTEQARIIFLLAMDSPGDAGWRSLAVRSVADLMRICRTQGGSSPHTFSVLARDGGQWLESAVDIQDEERVRMANDILAVIALGRRMCSTNLAFMGQVDADEHRMRKLLRSSDGGFPV